MRAIVKWGSLCLILVVAGGALWSDLRLVPGTVIVWLCFTLLSSWVALVCWRFVWFRFPDTGCLFSYGAPPGTWHLADFDTRYHCYAVLSRWRKYWFFGPVRMVVSREGADVPGQAVVVVIIISGSTFYKGLILFLDDGYWYPGWLT